MSNKFSQRKVSLLILLTLLAMLIFGCMGRDSKTDINTNDRTNTVLDAQLRYQKSEIPIPDDFLPIAASYTNSEIYLFDGNSILVMNIEGIELRRIVFSEVTDYIAFDLQTDGSLWVMSSTYNGINLEEVNFVHFSHDGIELERVIVDGSLFGENEEKIYISDLIVEDDFIYLKTFDTVHTLNKSSQFIMEIRAAGKNLRDSAIIRSLFRLGDGRIAVASTIYGVEPTNIIQIPNLESNETEEFIIPISGTNNIFTTGKQAGILLCTNNGFFEYEHETNSQILLFDNLKYGVNINDVTNVMILSDGSIVIAKASLEGKINRLVRFAIINLSDEPEDSKDISLIDESIITEKQTVLLSVININDTWLSMAIADFNRNSTRFHIEMNDYSMNGLIDFNEAVTRFNLDIISGNVPDIFVLHFNMQSNSYISKGLFANLNEFIENDSEFDRNDYLPGLFEAMEREGKLYELFSLFWLDAILAKTTDVGSEAGWTLNEFMTFLEANPNSKYVLGYVTRREFISRMIRNQFINPLSGEPTFDRNEFKRILAIAERFPTDIPQQMGVDEFMRGLKDSDPLMFSRNVVNFTNVKTDEFLYFGEEVTLKGWPSSEGNGLQFIPLNYFSISAQAENPEGAWEFVKYILNNSKCRLGINFPVKLSLLDEMAETELSNFNNPESIITGGIRSQDLGFNEYDIRKIMDVLKATKLIERRNLVIRAIIMEEVDSYLSGAKSADVVADIIENRVTIYLAEQD